mgnify:FL=1
MFDVYNVVLLMFIKIIKSTNEGFFSKIVELSMYKICIKTYLHIKQILLLKQYS